MNEERHGPLEFRFKEYGEIVDVSFPERRIELIVMPYETETEITEPGGRSYTEVVARGAFDGVQRRLSEIKVYSDHQVGVDTTLGKTLALHPSRTEGLVADLQISKSRQDVLIKAEEGLLGASAGFAVMAASNGHPRGEEWRGRGYRRLTRLWLGHIGLTPEPAYPGTMPLSVRNAEQEQSVTPMLDRYLEQEKLEYWQAQEAILNQRYHLG
jgi:phage head maturation protease